MIDLGFEPEVQKILEFLPVSNMKPDTGEGTGSVSATSPLPPTHQTMLRTLRRCSREWSPLTIAIARQ